MCRVVDVGAGHCAAARIPDGSGGLKYIIFDGGNRHRDVRGAIAEVIPPGSRVELLILSHNDQDHVGEVPWICATYDVRRCLHPGDQAHDPRPNSAGYRRFRQAHRAIDDEKAGGMVEHDFSEDPVPHGTTYPLGEGSLMILSGWDESLAEWGYRVAENQSKRRNSISICAWLEYEGRSILFTGDAFGRWDGDDPAEPAVATERYLIDNAADRPIDSDVFIAPHHGADNGTSLELLEAVSPLFAVYPAGSKYSHPKWTTVSRAKTAGVPYQRQYRTDLGDRPGSGEWRFGQEPGGDDIGDDHVDIYIIKREGTTGWVDLWYADEEAPDDEIVNYYSARSILDMDLTDLPDVHLHNMDVAPGRATTLRGDGVAPGQPGATTGPAARVAAPRGAARGCVRSPRRRTYRCCRRVVWRRCCR